MTHTDEFFMDVLLAGCRAVANALLSGSNDTLHATFERGTIRVDLLCVLDVP